MFKMNKNTPLTQTIINNIINQFYLNELPRLEKLEKYYKGNHQILQRQMVDKTKPNNKIVNPFANYIVDMFVGYFLGKPVTYTSKNEDYLKELNLINVYNDEHDENSEIAKCQSIYGVAYEILYIDEDKAIRFKLINPKEMIIIYDDTIEEEILYAIRVYENEDLSSNTKTYIVEVYDAQNITVYETSKLGGELKLISETPHNFSLVPIVEYKNNNEKMGDFENVITLIDAYDKLISDSVNDFEYFSDAYLALYGVDADAEDIKTMKENRVILMPQDSKAEWLIKNVNDVQIENLKIRLEQDIHKFSKCPALTDKDFASNASGVAMKYKIMGMENVISTKERKFKKGIQKRIELITNILNLRGNNYDWREIEIVFTRNTPQNIVETTEIVNNLRGLVSTQTLLSLLPFVNNAKEEMELLQQEKSEIFSFNVGESDEN